MTFKAELHLSRRLNPKAWALINPKVFHGCDRFSEYRWVYFRYAEIAAATRTREVSPDKALFDIKYRHEYDCNLTQHLKWGFPFYFVEPLLLEAVEQTDIAFEVEWATMPLPFEALTFVLPAHNEYGIDCIEVVRMTADEAGVEGFAPRVNPNQLSKVFLTLRAYASDQFDLQVHMTEPYHPDSFHTLKDGSEVTRKRMVRIAFNVLLAMAARPEYVETGHRQGRHKKSGSDIWSPNVIGRKYATKRDSAAETGTHASPRMHWRRGHFRHQPFGSRENPEHKVIWIEPMLIAAPRATAASAS
jgi:hypothetical protein